MTELGDNHFLFTWKPEKWSHAKLRELVDAFEAGRVVVERWRCQAHRTVRPGARAYLLKQGDSPRGIFAVAEVIGPAEERDDAKAGEGRYVVPLRFDVLFDPIERFLVSESDLLNLPAPPHRWNTQASGVVLEAEAARVIDEIIAGQKRGIAGSSPSGGDDGSWPGKYERLAEVYQRDQTLVDELKHLYKGRCQICSSVPFNGHFGNIVEGHHIEWLCRGGRDSLDNMVLLCPNHHAAIHAADPAFDRIKLEFRFGSKVVPIRLDFHLKPAN